MSSNDASDLTCPSCGSEDAVPAPQEAHSYECVSCGALFDREQGI